MPRETVRRILIAVAAGAAAGALVWLAARADLENQFGRSAASLREQLATEGSILRTETQALCDEVARAALEQELDRLGITPALVRDVSDIAQRLGIG